MEGKLMADRVYNKTVLASKLKTEIDDAIPEILNSIVVLGGSEVHLSLHYEPSAGEDTILNNLINAHTPSILGYKIWDMVDVAKEKYLNPKDINFDILPLAKQKIFIKGEPSVFTYYKQAVVNSNGTITYSDPVLKTTWTFTRDSIGFSVYAEEKAEWYLENDTLGSHQKIIPHYFDGYDKIEEGKRRRGHLLDALMIPISGMIIYHDTVAKGSALTLAEIEVSLQKGRAILSQYQAEFSNFINHRDVSILTSLQNDTDHPSLNLVVPGSNPSTTIRAYIIAEMTI
jgi:hypothetical protein